MKARAYKLSFGYQIKKRVNNYYFNKQDQILSDSLRVIRVMLNVLTNQNKSPLYTSKVRIRRWDFLPSPCETPEDL